MADKKENVQLEKTMDKAEQEKLESVKKADAAVKTMQDFTSPEVLYEELIASVKKYHPSTDISMIRESLRSGQGSPQRSEAKIRRAVYHTSSLCGNHTCRS